MVIMIIHNEIRDLTTLVDVVWGMPQCVSRTTTTTNHWGELYLISHASANVSQSWGKIGCWRNGVWGSHYEWSFFDVRIFNPFSTSNRYSSFPATYVPQTWRGEETKLSACNEWYMLHSLLYYFKLLKEWEHIILQI